MQQVFYERRRVQTLILFQNRRHKERRKIYRDMTAERRRILAYTSSKNGEELVTALKKSNDFHNKRVTSRIKVGLPVVMDFQGNLSRGVSVDLSPGGLSINSDIFTVDGSNISIQFCFAQNFAYMNLVGRVISVKEKEESFKKRFRIAIQFLPMKDPEQTILESCLQEFRLGFTRDLTVTNGAGPKLESDPRSIISLFVTDNPFLLDYHNRSRLEDLRSNGVNPLTKVKTPKVSSRRFLWQVSFQGFKLALQLVRDLLVQLLPSAISRILLPNISFAFIVHPRDLSDVSRKVPFARFLPPPLVELWLRHQWPVVGSYITGLKTKNGKEAKGAMLISPLSTIQMIQNSRLARKRVYQTVKLAEKMGAKIIGLGAFTSIVTRDGHDLLGKVDVGITTGNSYTAAVAVENVVMAAIYTNLSLPHCTAAIVGGAGSIGSACAKLLSRVVAKLILIDHNEEELQKVVQQLKNQSIQLEGTSRIDLVKQADLIIVVTNSPYTVISAEHLKPGAIVSDVAQPKNVSEVIPFQRRDVLVIESGIVNVPGVDYNFDLGLGVGEALGCLSETMILTAMGWQGHYSLGKADPKQATEMMKAGRELGLRLAYFRNSLGYITEEDLARVAIARMAKSPRV